MRATVTRLFHSCADVLRSTPITEDARQLALLQELVDKGVLFPVMGNTHGFEEVYFFKVDVPLDGERALEKYRSLGLEPVDWDSLAWINENDHSLAESHPNGTQWRDNERWRYLAFNATGKEYGLQTGTVRHWLPGSWLAGRPIEHKWY